MSVLIMGFEKPDHCLRCPMKGTDDECVLQGVEVCDEYENWKQQMANCPLVPVPPHGRLIDGDALLEWANAGLRFGDPDFHAGLWHTISAIEDAPTIIPAEPPKEET